TEWDVESAIATYNVDRWGGDYFTINSAGNVEARPLQENGGNIDILEVVNEARSRGLGFPLVIRFQDLLRHRVESVNRAFQTAMSEFGHRNEYRGVFPIKDNQLREVIEDIIDAGLQFHLGLEAGSKPEMVAERRRKREVRPRYDQSRCCKSDIERCRSDTLPQTCSFPCWIAGTRHLDDQARRAGSGPLLRKAR